MTEIGLFQQEYCHECHKCSSAAFIADQARRNCPEDGVSADQFIASAVAEKLSALMTANYLRKRAGRSSREAFEQALSEIPDAEPEDDDKI